MNTINYSNPLVSVLIPVYNSDKYLERCLNSISNQTYRHLEIIIVDDGSTDKSSSICDEFCKKDSRARVYHNENHGISYTRNFALDHTKGEYVFWIDSDDYVAHNAVELLLDYSQEYDSDYVICQYKKGDEDDYKFIRDKSQILSLSSSEALNLIYEDDYRSFLLVTCWGKLIKKDVYNGVRFPDGYIFEDVATSHYVLNNCKRIIMINDCFYYYYQIKDSILGKKVTLAKLDYLYFFEDRIAFFKKINNSVLMNKARLQYLHSLIWEFSRVKDILRDDYKLQYVIKQYRNYYKLGDFNSKFKYESKVYMYIFYVSPYLFDLIQKVQGRFLNG